MRNTFVAKEQQHSLGLQSAFGLSTHLSLDSESGLTYVARNGLTVACCRCADGQVLRSVSLPEAAAQGGFDLAPSAVITHFAHVPELEAITIGLSSGELLLLNTATAAIADSASGGGSSVGIQLPTLEEVGAVEGGVAAGQWSPDGELLALLTGDGQLLLMNKEWELLAERPVRGHYERSSADFQLQHDQVAISWRGDGRYVATCTPQQAQHSVASTAGAAALGPESPAGYCEVCIWEREGLEPHATGEHAPALYPLLSWQPNGRHLYAAQKLSAAQQAAQQAADQGQHAAEDEEAQQARIGAWKREMRRQEAEAAAAAAAGGEASNRVVLYERNGLQHGGFDVPGPGVVAAMGWSRDSDLLAIVLKDGGRGGSGLPSCRLQLWHRSNWHWYLKSERRFEMCEGLAIQWDDLAARRLHILTSDGDYLQVDMDWCPLVSGRGTAAVLDGRRVLLTPLRHAIVPPPMCSAALQCSGALACAALCDFGDREVLAAVLGDGSLELATSCEEDLWEETLDEHQEAQEAASAGAEPAGRAGAQQAQQAASCGSEPCLLAQQLSFLETTVSLVGARQAAWAAEDRLLVVVGEGQVVELRINSEAGTATQVAALRLPVPLVCCISQPQRGCILQLEGGQLLQYEPGGQLREQPVAGSFPTSCPCMVASPAVATGRALPLAFGLSSKGQLYWGSQLLANDVTSVVVRAEGAGGAFLLYTTRTHLLYSLPLSSLEQQQQQPGSSRPGLVHLGSTAGAAGQPQQQSFSQAMRAAMRPEAAPGGAARDVRVRAVEQNALLVAAPPGGEVVVLQMPRGNLEVIRPRALVLPAVAAAIDGGDWARAWELASVNRLDLNVLVDYQWPAFLSRARDFIQQVGSDQDIADLLSALSPNSAVAEGGTYAGGLAELPPTAAAAAAASLAGPALATLPVRTNPGQTEIANGGLVVMMNGSAKEATAQEPRQQEQQQHGKVAAVCRAVRGAIEVTDMPARFLRSLLTSYAKCDELEGALAIVKQRKEAELQGGAVPGAPSAEEGLKHLLLFINEDVVYRAALGAYDLPLAYMVVAHSQKDPGEYMMELQRFASLPEGPLRSHAIDMHLRRFESALRHLVAAGPENSAAALELAKDKGLLRLLLELYESHSEREDLRREALAAYAEELERKNMDEDAGLAYLAAGLPERATEAYMVAGQWRMALALAGKLGRGQEETLALAAELAEELAGSARLADAAAVTLEYLQDVAGAVSLLARGHEWREALRVAYSYQRGDMVDSMVAPQAAAAASETLRDIEETLERVGKYSSRLKDLRQRRHEIQAALAAADEEAGLPSRHRDADFDDAASEAVSLLSGLSVYTDRTHTGATTSAGSSLAPSTVGGRRTQRRNKKNKGTRIRQGSPEEEQQLAQHILSLAPSSTLCSQVGQLTETLVVLGHEGDARLLQQRLGVLCTAQQAAVQDVLQNPPPGLAMQLSWQAQQALAAQQAKQGASGNSLGTVVAAVLAAVPRAELQLKAAEAQASHKASRWKWDMLRTA